MSDAQSRNRLKALRDQLDEVDAGLVELAAKRQQLVSEIGRHKQSEQRQLRDFRREREVMSLVRGHAERIGLDPALAEDLFKRLINASLTRQEQERVRLAGRGDGSRALVIGGCGRMGRWLAAFLDNQGYEVHIADPAAEPSRSGRHPDWRAAPLDVDLIAVATPLGETAAVIDELAARRVPGLVFDIGSLKTPLIESLQSAAGVGLNICSLHPMFGPDTRLLSGRNVLVMDVGNQKAVDDAAGLFADTMAAIVHVPLEEHDRLAAMVLGLSHALNIAFFTALAECGIEAGRLAQVSSATFEKQLAVARGVAGESPALYYEIQALNRYGRSARDALARAVARLERCMDSEDPDGFRRMMETGHTYLSGISSSNPPD